jgi:hypothetical protein
MKSTRPKWWNPTGNSDWDDYYDGVMPILIPALLLVMLLIALMVVAL